MAENKYRAAAYIRLSHKDTDVCFEESDSITSQRVIIRAFADGLDEVKIVEEFVDDGFSGMNFERPAFKRMMEKIYKGDINCVICKDLSRFGRNYIEVGRYFDRIFPSLGVRVISVNERIDTDHQKEWLGMLMPIYNLMNESYCKDISVKIRTQLATKRKKGQFVGPFAPYGYKKAADNKNQLVIDEETADIVRYIFKRRIEGESNRCIALELNEKGILSPGEYRKNSCNVKKYAFQKKEVMEWDSSSVKRILENEIYIGNLVQGKTTTPNFKVTKQVPKPEEEWDRVNSTHEPIIDKRDYYLVQKLLSLDTKKSPVTGAVYPLAGLICCSDCGWNMTRKIVRKIVYYQCGNYKRTLSCSAHNVRVEIVQELVMVQIKKRIREVKELEKRICSSGYDVIIEKETEKLNAELADVRKEINVYERKIDALSDAVRGQVISEEERQMFLQKYCDLQKELKKREEDLLVQIQDARENVGSLLEWMVNFTEFDDPEELTRYLAVRTIDKIIVHKNHVLDIRLNNEEEYRKIKEYLEDSI